MKSIQQATKLRQMIWNLWLEIYGENWVDKQKVDTVLSSMLHEHHEGAPYLSFGTPAIEIYMYRIQMKILRALLYLVYFRTVRRLLCKKRKWRNTFDNISSFGGEGCQVSWESMRNPSGTATSPLSPLPTTIIQLVCPLVNQRRNEVCHPSLRATFRNLFEEANVCMWRRILAISLSGS